MNCKQVKTYITDYIDNNLPIDVYNNITSHLAECPDCRMEIEDVRNVISTIESISPEEPVIDLWQDFLCKMDEEGISLSQQKNEVGVIKKFIVNIKKGFIIFQTVVDYNMHKKYIARS